MLDRKCDPEAPEQAWQDLESRIALADSELAPKIMTNTDAVVDEVSSRIVARLERLARAIARLYTIGKIGSEAGRHLSYVASFLNLADEQLGKRRYDSAGDHAL